MRVYELARELDMESKELLERAHDLGIDVKTASSGLDDEAAELLRLAVSEEEKEEEEAEAPTEEAPAVAVDEEPADELPTEEAPATVPAAEELEPAQPLEVTEGLTVMELADAMGRGAGSVVKSLLAMGEMVTPNSVVPRDAIELVGDEFGFDITVLPGAEPEEEIPLAARRLTFDDPEDTLQPRPPVITVMGHVDHGKTLLLDKIREANVVAGEAGGITQHIGAYQIAHKGKKLTFIDTPGHEAFTTLRARGAVVTDIVVLVVAADDGVMPQTQEAINHAKAAGVPIVVAINKTDLETADPVSVRAQLTEHDVVVEALGGDVTDAEISALTGKGIDHLLEVIDLVAELEEIRANPDASASGTVIESELDKGRGPVGTVIVQRGTLRQGDALVAGRVAGRVRAMFDENGNQVKEALPSTPVLLMGWDDVPDAGAHFTVVESEKEARALAAAAQEEQRAEEMGMPSAADRLEQLMEQIRTADHAEVRAVLKADTHGSLEALRDAVAKITREDGRVTIIHGAVGGISENDVVLADASEAIVFGFNVRPDSGARKAAEAAGVEIRTHRVIYELLDEVESILLGQLAPEEVEELLGVAEVRATFRSPRYGMVAGCYVTEGEMRRNAKVRLVRDGVVVYDGVLASLRRFKDDVPAVAAGFECGIGLANYSDVKEGDLIESYLVREVARV